jgi:hypothetical protein
MAEFYSSRAAKTHRLVERHGFRILARGQIGRMPRNLTASFGSLAFGASVTP